MKTNTVLNFAIMVIMTLIIIAFSAQVYRAEALSDRFDQLVKDQQTLVFSFESTSVGTAVVTCQKIDRTKPYVCSTTQSGRTP